jgi:hypothetical protein
VAPVITEKCTACHTKSGIAPFALDTYADASQAASIVAAVVMSGQMPPYLAQETDACQPRQPWKNDIRLSQAEKDLIQKWAANGAPEGDPAKAAALKYPAPIALPREDVVIPWPEAITVDGNKDIHTCVVVDPKIATDAYVTGRLITAGNPKVLHHVVSYIIQPGKNDDGTPRTKAQLEEAVKAEKGVGIGGRYDCFGGAGFSGGKVSTELLDAWAPGGVANLAPPDSGQPISKEALVLLDVHYHPIGKPETDSGSKLALMLADARPNLVARTILLGNFRAPESAPFDSTYGQGALMQQPDETAVAFNIPPYAKNHIEEMTWKWKELPFPEGFRVFGLGTHMHYVGRGMRITLEHANGDSECLIETPAWDFNWQRGYAYDATYDQLPTMLGGDTLRMRCDYDNSMDNRFVVQALDDQGLSEPVDVPLGEDTLNEMCLGAFGITYPNTNP